MRSSMWKSQSDWRDFGSTEEEGERERKVKFRTSTHPSSSPPTHSTPKPSPTIELSRPRYGRRRYKGELLLTLADLLPSSLYLRLLRTSISHTALCRQTSTHPPSPPPTHSTPKLSPTI
ncbi:hypothetical protein Droror1_Dr00017736 [Drosera rotundifolia]